MAVPLFVADFYGRRIDILGRVQGVKANVSASGVKTTIFKAGGTLFPSNVGVSQPLVQGRCLALFITIENYSASMPVSTNFSFGSLPAGNDYLANTDISTFVASYSPSPIIFGDQLQSAASPPIVYAAGTSFACVNNSGSASTDLWTITAYGCSY
jgi:hypothetical protein